MRGRRKKQKIWVKYQIWADWLKIKRESLKRYSVILTTSFYDMNQRIQTKMLISKISSDSNFTFSSYAWLCMFQCSHRLLCWIKSRRQDFLWKLLSYHTKLFQPNSFWGNVLLRGELQKDARNLNFENWESALYSKSGNMPLNFDSTEF